MPVSRTKEDVSEFSTYMYDPEVETLTKTDLRNLQLRRLQDTVARVYHRVPFYRRKFQELGIKPEDVTRIEDIERLPFTRKSDLRDNYPYGLFAVDRKDVVRIHGSSGTKGKPTVVGYTAQDLDNWSDIVARAIAIAGGRPGDVFHNAYGYGLFTGGLGLHTGAERLGTTVVPVSGGNTARQVLLLEDFLPRGIGGTPSYVLNIASYMEQNGRDPSATSLEYGIFGAEPWTEEMRRALETKLGLRALDIYGLSEVMGPGVAMECYDVQDGLHVAEDHFYVEVIDPQSGDPLSAGQLGELVFTSLTKEAFPVIRYRTGDLAYLYEEPCACGRTHVRMSRIKGRIDDMLVIRGVNVFPSEIESVVVAHPKLSPHYQIHVERIKNMDEITVFVETSAAFASEVNVHNQDSDVVRSLEHEIKSQLRQTIGISTSVALCEPGEVPRSEGKAVRVVDKRNLYNK